MPTQLLPVGPPVVITQNVVYALPNRVVTITTSAACETSVDNVVWTAFTSGSESSANFLRCTTTGPTVTCKAVGGFTSGSGSGASLPTAPLGQVLVSQGDGVAPVFSHELTLINPIAPSGQRSWQISVVTDGTFRIRLLNDAGLPVAGRRVEIDPYAGGFAAIAGPLGASISSVSGKWFSFSPVVFSELAGFSPAGTPGNIANITNSSTNVIGAIVAGGGANNVLIRWDGTNWRVIGV